MCEWLPTSQPRSARARRCSGPSVAGRGRVTLPDLGVDPVQPVAVQRGGRDEDRSRPSPCLEDRRGGGRDGLECVVEGDRDESLVRRRRDDGAERLASIARLLEVSDGGLEPRDGHAEARIGPGVVDCVEAEQQLRRPSEQVGDRSRDALLARTTRRRGTHPPSRCRDAVACARRAHEDPRALFPDAAPLERRLLPKARASRPHQTRPVRASGARAPRAAPAVKPRRISLSSSLTQIGPPVRRAAIARRPVNCISACAHRRSDAHTACARGRSDGGRRPRASAHPESSERSSVDGAAETRSSGTGPADPRPPVAGLVTYDAKDPATSFPPIEPLLPPDGAPQAPHHVPTEWSDKYKGAFDDGWDAQRERTFAKQKELGVIPPDAELTARPEEIPAWDDMPDDLKPVLARQMEVYAGFLEHTDHHVGPAGRRAGRARDPRAHARLLRDRRQRRLGRGDADRLLQRARRPERGVRPRDDRVHGLEDRRLRHSGGLQPLRRRLGACHGHAVPVDEADRVALGRHAERHDRPLAGRDQGARRGPPAVPSRDRRRADRPRGRRAAGPAERQRGAAAPARGRLDDLLVRRRGRRRPPHDPVLRDVLQPGHLPRGLDRRDEAQHPVGVDRDARLRRRRLGALRARRLDAGARPRVRAAREARGAPAALPARGGEVQRPAARRPPLRAVQPRSRRAPAARPGLVPAPLRPHGTADGELRRRRSRTSRTRSPRRSTFPREARTA